MERMKETGRKDRTWLWIAVAAAIVAVVALRIPVGTVLYLGAFLGFPLLMMRMHGGGHGGGQGGGFGCGGGDGGSSQAQDGSEGTEGGPSGHRH